MGPNHYRKAEELEAKADEYVGRGEGQESAAVPNSLVASTPNRRVCPMC